MSNNMQIILSLGQSLSVGATLHPTIFSAQPRFPDKALALDFGNPRLLSSGWGNAPVKEASFIGFSPIIEVGRETHVSGMVNQLINQYEISNQPPPSFVHINAGFGGASIVQLMLGPEDVYQSVEAGFNSTEAGGVFAVLRADGRYDSYYRLDGSSAFIRTVSGPFNVFENVKTQIQLAFDHANLSGYDVKDSLIFNWIQGQSDNGAFYSELLAELIRKIDNVVDVIMQKDASLVGVVSQVRGYGGKSTSFEQLKLVNDDIRIALGATEFQYQASHPSKAGTDYTHLSSEGYFLMGQDIGLKIYNLINGLEDRPILIEKIEYVSQNKIRVTFSGVDTKLVNDPSIYDSDNFIRPPSNLGISIDKTSEGLSQLFKIVSVDISGDRQVDITFDSDLDRDFVIYIGRNKENLGDEFAVNLGDFGGSSLRDERELAILPPMSSATLSRSVIYEYAPIQSFSVKIADLLPPLSTVGPIIDGSYIFGTDANDTLSGSEKNDFISGVPEKSINLGVSRIDILSGGGGNDLFVLGDSRGNFYNRNSDMSFGTNDHAKILDFTSGDKVQLAPGAYLFSPTGTATNPGTALWFDRDGNGQISLIDELIAYIWGAKRPSFADIVIHSDQPTPPPAPSPTPEPVPTGPTMIVGTDASDTLDGTSGEDIIIGVPSGSTTRGRGTVDRMTGGGGNDVFVIGDESGNFYSLNRDDNWGTMDHALITDFSVGDSIRAAPGNYLFQKPTSTIPFWGVWFDRDNDGRLTVVDELVARVGGTKAPTLADLAIAAGQSQQDQGAVFASASPATILSVEVDSPAGLQTNAEPQFFTLPSSWVNPDWASNGHTERVEWSRISGFHDIVIA